MLSRLIIFGLILWVARGSTKSVDQEDRQSTVAARNTKSEEIRNDMNESADPCEDYFEFACGNWKTVHPAGKKVRQTRAFSRHMDEFQPKLNKLLTSTAETDKETETDRKVKNFYQSCMNLASLTQPAYHDKLRSIINEFGKMPALEGDAWKERDFDWLETIAQISYKYGIQIMFGYEVYPDYNNNTVQHLMLGQQEFCSLGRSSIERAITSSLINVNLKVHLNLKINETQHLVGNDVGDFDFILWEAAHQASTKNWTTIEDMQHKYSPDLDIKKLMNISFGSIPQCKVFDKNPDYEQTLIDLINKTPKSVVANYIFYQLITKFSVVVPQNEKDLEEFCADETQEYFGQILSNMFYRAYNLSVKVPYYEDMWQQIKYTFQNILESEKTSWLDDVSRKYALEKLHAMKLQILTYESKNFAEEYAQLELNSHDFIENRKSLMAFNARRTRASLYQAPHISQTKLRLGAPANVLTENSIVIPVTVLASDSFWSSSYPNAVNLARLGYLIAHEIIHGFSGRGLYFDKLGNQYKSKWWNKDIEAKYAERRTCFHDQYHNYTVGGKPLPQDDMQSENSADNAGIILTYETYRSWLKNASSSKQELDLETLPNLNYTSRQLFFISYSQIWCADTYEPWRSQAAALDHHSPDEIRTFAPLLNFEEFSTVFNCPTGSVMNPAMKCTLF